MTSEADRMCQREGRDGQGRFRAGASGNPRGRPKVTAMARLLAAAEAVGARIVVELPRPAEPEPVEGRAAWARPPRNPTMPPPQACTPAEAGAADRDGSAG